jgi:hypothetical protein
MADKVKVEQVNQDKNKDKHPGVRHGSGTPGSIAGRLLNCISLSPGRQVLEKKAQTCNNMEEKEGKQANLCNVDQDAQ